MGKKGAKWAEKGLKRGRKWRKGVFFGVKLSVCKGWDASPQEKLFGEFLGEVMPLGNTRPLKTIFFYVLSRRPGQATDASAMRPYLWR